MIERLDHINIRTEKLDAMVEWYGRILDMHPGKRPGFPFPGAWLYAGGFPIVHLVGIDAAPGSDPDDLRLEHGAFRASGMAQFLARLDEAGERREVVKVPGFPIVQVNVWDPDGNHLHIDFDASEMPAG
jgi:catechol 2,3-dioxygenase-like lactoylglutathione lyase family enzyme